MDKEFIKNFPMFLKLGVKNRKFLQLIFLSMKAHKKMEYEFRKKLENYIKREDYTYSGNDLNHVRYLEKNFFSILLLSIFQNLKMENKRVMNYGVVLHSLRGIITCTDNIIDLESKGNVFLEKLSSPPLKNVMLTLILQNILNDTVRELADNKEMAAKMLVKVTDAIYSIANGENLRELGDSIESPEEIIEGIHKKIGGELLELAFVVPAIKEKNSALNRAKEGVFEIGVALQMLDDICDLVEDAESRKKNLLFSQIVYNVGIGVDELLSMLKEGKIYDAPYYKESYVETLCSAIERALTGFEILEETGYPVNRELGEAIMEFMFQVRGIKESWEIFKKSSVGDELYKNFVS